MCEESNMKPAPFAQWEAVAVKDGGGGGESGDVQRSAEDLNLDAEEAVHGGWEDSSSDGAL